MSNKLIKIDLSIFFDDERKLVFILVDPSWKNVECLQKRIELLFDVDSVRFLSDGCFLPPQEPIEILQYFTNIKAFVPKESLEIRKERKSKKIKNIEEISGNTKNEESFIAEIDKPKPVNLKKKRKSTCLESVNSPSSLLDKPKRSKSSHMNSLLEIEDAKEVDNEVEHDNQSSGSKNPSKVKSFAEKSLVSVNSNDQHKRRHSSTPKGNKSPIAETDMTSNNEVKTKTAIVPSSIPSSTLIGESIMVDQDDNAHHSSKSLNPNNPFKQPKCNTSHIYFNGTGEVVKAMNKKKLKIITKKDKEPKAIIIFRCPLSDVTNGTESEKPRVFHLESKKTLSKKDVVEIQEEIILPPHLIQISRNQFHLTNEQTAITGADEQKENNESIEKSSFNYTIIDKCNTITAENDYEEEVLVKKLREHQKEELKVSALQNQSQMDSIMHIDGDVTYTQCKSETNLKSHIDDDITEKQNKSQVELSNIEEGVTGNQSESQLPKSNINEVITAFQNGSQVELTNINGNVNISPTDTTHFDKDVDKKDNKNKVEQKIIDEASITSIDCVDLSHDVDENLKLEEIDPVKHDLTADNESNESDVEEISEIIDLNESQDNFNASTEYKSSDNQIRVKDILPLSIDLENFPSIEDIIIFKVPYMKKNKQIVTTDFIAGKVEYVNKRTKNIKILIVDGVSELCHVPNKLIVCNMDDSLDIIKYMQLKLTDMCEAKLFSMSSQKNTSIFMK